MNSFENETFNKIYTVNTIYFWTDPEKCAKEILRVLQPDGKLVISIRSKKKLELTSITNEGFTLYEPDDVKNLLENVGFLNVQVEENTDRVSEFYSIIAEK